MQEATSRLEQAGLSTGITEVRASDEIASGLVISSDPAAGVAVDGGTEVDILMSAGPLASSPKVMSLHERVEAALSELWTELALTSEMEGEIKAAHHGLQTLFVEIGEREPTAEQTRQIDELQALIARFEESITERSSGIKSLQAEVETLRARLETAVRQVSPAILPTLVTVTCTGDGEGGTALSAPAVTAQDDGVHIRVVNEIPNEPVFLDLGIGGPPIEVAAGDRVEHVLQNPPTRTIAVICTYETPPRSWERPAHHLAVIRVATPLGAAPSRPPAADTGLVGTPSGAKDAWRPSSTRPDALKPRRKLYGLVASEGPQDGTHCAESK